MPKDHQQLDEEFVKLALAINEHLPGYVDSYFGPGEWTQAAKQAGRLPLLDLIHRAGQLAFSIDQAHGFDAQRRDFLVHQIRAMQMSLRLLTGERVSLTEEVQVLYDVQPKWKDESIFVEAQKVLDQLLPSGGPLKERFERWNKSLEIPIGKVRELLPFITKRLRELAREKFSLPEDESFTVEFVSNQPWGAYNWYLGDYKSRIDINTDLPIRVNRLAGLIAHEGYPGHHTELSIKESKLIRQKNYREHILTLINTPSCVISEGIATTALKTVLPDSDLEGWYREEILPHADVTQIDPNMMIEIGRAAQKMFGVWSNAAFMLHDQNKSTNEISLYAQKYGLSTEREADQRIKFISNPLYRSYIFTYSVGHDLFEELFSHGDRDKNFARLLDEPITPSQIRQWIHN